MPVFNNVLAGAAGSGGAGAFEIERSLRFNEPDNSFLEKTYSSAGNRKKWTWSGWVKKSKITDSQAVLFSAYGGSGNAYLSLDFRHDQPRFLNWNGSGIVDEVKATAKLRDPSAWYHIVWAVDTDQATDANKVKLYINGVQQTSFETANYPSTNASLYISNNIVHEIGRNAGTSSANFNGHLADVNFVDGQQLAPNGVFGEFDADTGVWNPIKFTGSYTTSSPNDGTVWSNSVSNAGNSPTYLFDGGTSQYVEGSTDGTAVTWSGNITGITKLEFYGVQAGSSRTFTVNGTDKISLVPTTAGWFTVSGITSLTAFSFSRGGSGNYVDLFAVRVNDEILQDSVNGRGINSFKLGFSDNSSNAALGFDANVSGTRYSSMMSGNTNTNFPFSRMFDGDTSTATLGQNGQTFTFTPTPALSYEAASGGVEVYFASHTNQPDKYRINGGSWVNQTATGWNTVTTGDGTLNSIEFSDQASNEAVVYAIRVNGTILTDPSGANDWTVNNIQSTSFDAVGASSHVGPGNLTNLAPGTYYNMFAVDSNNVSSNPGSGALVRFNFSQLGLTAPATITFDSYEQGGGGWTTVSNNIYTDAGTVTSSSTSSGNTRSNTVNIPSGATYFELPGSYNSQYSLYSNGIHNLVWDGVSYQHLGPEGIDSLIDSPTNYEADSGNNGGNYCTWNPLTMSRGTMSDGNLLFYGDGTNTPRVNGTISASSGKWYYESYVLKPGPGTGSGDVHNSIGWGLDTVSQIESAPNTGAMNHSFYFMDSGWYQNFTGSNTNTGNGKWAPGDVIGVAADLDNNTLTFYRNGTQVLSQTIGVTAGTSLCPAHQSNTGNYGRLATNFGQRPFKYPPGGTGGPAATFKALCTQNLEPLIEDPSTAFETKLYDGDGQSASSTQAITGLKFSPDFVWIKARDVVAGHALYDTVRPITQRLSSSQQTVFDNEGLFESFDSNGFTVKGNGNNTNALNQPYAAWVWDGGDLATNSAYNQSQVWSDSLSTNNTLQNPVNAFDADTSTRADTATGGANTTLTFGPTTGVSFSNSFEIYTDQGTSVPTATWNGNTVNPGQGAWVTVYTGSGTISASSPLVIDTEAASQFATLKGIRLDGKILVDAGLVPKGSQPNSAYNQEQKWTDFWSSTNGFEQNSQTFAFDLNDSNVSASASYGDTQSLVLTTGITYTQSVRAMTHYTSGTAYINGNSNNAVNVASGWITLATGSGTLNRVDFTSNNARAYVSKIEVDGKLLVDPTPSIPCTVRVNPTAKFSIVKYTAPGGGFFNVTHGLNATPGMIITKHTNRSSDWYVWHSAFTDDGDYISLNTTAAKSSATDFWSAAKPDSNTFGGKVDTSHLSGDTDIALCWAPVEGYSAFGSYEGTGTADGAFNYTGFTPRFILIKNMDNGSNRQWILIDSARNTFNQGSAEEVLFPNDNQIESRPDDGFGQFGTKDAVDILSNGFKLKEPNTSGVWTQVNNTSQTYIWAAFASDPLKYARAF